jgi:hypothetical protein
VSYISWKQSASADPGTLRDAIIVKTDGGLRLVTVDAVAHTDVLAIIPTRGRGSNELTWEEHRVNIFDLASGRRLARVSCEGTDYPRTELVGDLGGRVAVRQRDHSDVRLLDPADGHEIGDILALAPPILQLNPVVEKVRSLGYRESTGCIHVKSSTFEIRVDPRTLHQVAADECKRENVKDVTFSGNQALVIEEIRQEVPAGARPIGQTFGLFARNGRTTTPIEEQARFLQPLFAIDKYARQPLVAGEPPGALVLSGDDKITAALITAAGKTAWAIQLPTRELVLTARIDDQILIVMTSGKAVVIDPASGRTAREIDLE